MILTLEFKDFNYHNLLKEILTFIKFSTILLNGGLVFFLVLSSIESIYVSITKKIYRKVTHSF